MRNFPTICSALCDLVCLSFFLMDIPTVYISIIEFRSFSVSVFLAFSLSYFTFSVPFNQLFESFCLPHAWSVQNGVDLRKIKMQDFKIVSNIRIGFK